MVFSAESAQFLVFVVEVVYPFLIDALCGKQAPNRLLASSAQLSGRRMGLSPRSAKRFLVSL